MMYPFPCFLPLSVYLANRLVLGHVSSLQAAPWNTMTATDVLLVQEESVLICDIEGSFDFPSQNPSPPYLEIRTLKLCPHQSMELSASKEGGHGEDEGEERTETTENATDEELGVAVDMESSSDTLGEEEEELEPEAPEHEHEEPPMLAATHKSRSSRQISFAYIPPNIISSNEDFLRKAFQERSVGAMYPMPESIGVSFNARNTSMLDRRAWLEVEDPKHRYAKNLRYYYKDWDRRGQPGYCFWEWLDSNEVEVSIENLR